ncbi:hypothetical protein ACKWTF_010168 [Chironomus riparius]
MLCKSYTDIGYSSLIVTLLAGLIVSIYLITSHPEIETNVKCRFENGTSGVCVKNSNCFVREKFTGLFIGDDCGLSDLTCCLQDNILPDGTKDFEIHENFKYFKNKKCGIVTRPSHNVEHLTHHSEFPWIVSLGHINHHSHLKFTCGGSLINEKFILTTAQCVMLIESEFELSVIRLKFNRHSQNKEVEHLDIKDFKTIPHPDFDPASLQNDIALIKLHEALNFEDYKITPVCLPLEKEEKDLHGLIAIGKKSMNSKRLSRLLVTQVDIKECVKIINELSKNGDNFGDNRNKVIRHSTENQLCIFKDAIDSDCKDEHGMPLQSLSSIGTTTIWTQHGILSFDYSSCDLPSIYTNVRNYLRWIFDNIH